ncbi:MAG: RHS repeat domain-containing protein [Acutalibacteraceae bacterium]
MNEENKDTFNFQDEFDFSKNYGYNSDNRIINATIAALSLAYDYDEENVGNLSYSLGQGATKSFSYRYDENGNIISEQVSVDGVSSDVTAYEYDEDNQLISAENGLTKWTYSYDGRGNLTAENEYDVSLSESGEKVYTQRENDAYAYDTNWKDKLTSFNGQSISYDASGNPTSYLGHNLTWTMGRQLASFDGTTYTYDENGIRTSKTVGENTTEFYLNGTDVIYQTDGTNDIYFFYDRDNELVGFKYSGNNYFYVKNHMGDITDIANSNGEVVASYEYDPWGKVTSVSGSNLEIANLNPFRYRSYYYDSDIQMYYLQSRYYDPEVGRFINCDDVNYIGYSDTANSYNAFAYCENNSINREDTTGSFGTPIQWACALIGGIVGVPFGRWLANRLGYYSGWKYYAIRTAAVAGGVALGWFAGTALLKLIKNYLSCNPQVMIKIVSKFGPKILMRVRSIIGINFFFLEPRIVAEMIVNAERVGSGLKGDLYHRAASGLTKSQLAKGTVYRIDNGKRILLQVYGELNGKKGVFEYIIDESGRICHQLFKKGKVINGIPN